MGEVKYPMGAGEVKFALPISAFRRAGDTIYFAGEGAVDENGDFVGETLQAQMRYTMAKLGKTLTQAGVSWGDIVQVRAYVQNPADIPIYNAIYREFFPEPYPSRTTIVNCLPSGLLFEIDAVAYAPLTDAVLPTDPPNRAITGE